MSQLSGREAVNELTATPSLFQGEWPRPAPHQEELLEPELPPFSIMGVCLHVSTKLKSLEGQELGQILLSIPSPCPALSLVGAQ